MQKGKAGPEEHPADQDIEDRTLQSEANREAHLWLSLQILNGSRLYSIGLGLPLLLGFAEADIPQYPVHV